MRWLVSVAVVMMCAGGAASPLLAQEKTPPAVTRDSDRDGVPDVRDRCRNTPVGTRVDATGCPAPAQQAQAPVTPAQPTPVQPPAPQAVPLPAAPAAAAPAPAAAVPAPAAAAPAPAAGAPVVANQAQTPAPSIPVQPAAAVAPAPLGQPSGAAEPSAAKPAPPPQAGPPSAAAPGPVTPGVTVPAVVAAAAPSGPAAPRPAAPAVTAGFFMPPFTGSGEAERVEYLRSMAVRLDSALRGLVAVFAGTAGSAVPAEDPTQLSQRVRDRWARCDEHYLDLISFSDAVQLIKDSLPNNPLVRRAADGLDNALQEMAALGECDNIVSMVNRPQDFNPWGPYYEASTRNFYRDWYTQLRAVHEADRTFARQLNGVLAADRVIPPLTALPSAPPTAGAMVR